MAYITRQDFKDTFIRFWQHGALGYLGKVFKTNANRTITTFDLNAAHANWWLLPQAHNMLHTRLNIGALQHYMELAYINAANLCGYKNLRILSVGCGSGAQEFLWAHLLPKCTIDAIDITPKNIAAATKLAATNGYKNINFMVSSWEAINTNKKYDIVLFHSSLHHLANMAGVFNKIKVHLNSFGVLVLHDYVGAAKHQFTQTQLQIANQLLQATPKHLRKIFKTPFYKIKVGKPGLLRMYLNDPSEAIESHKIRPLLKQYTTPIFQQELGANVFVPYLKEIAHNFVTETDENTSILEQVFVAEKQFIATNQSDFIFGIYRFN